MKENNSNRNPTAVDTSIQANDQSIDITSSPVKKRVTIAEE
jgi:hypothetical protein